MPAANHDFDIEQGATFSQSLTFKDAEGSAINLTGCTFRGQVRRSATDSKLLANFAFDLTHLSTGIVVVSLSSTQTSSLPAEQNSEAAKATSELAYDIERVNVDETVDRIMQGVLNISPEVTR